MEDFEDNFNEPEMSPALERKLGRLKEGKLSCSKKSTGPKTALGKLRSSMNKVSTGGRMNQKGNSMFTKLVKKHGLKMDTPMKAVEQMEVFKFMFDQFGTNKLNEIESLLGVIRLLQTDVAVRSMEKITMGIPLDEEDIKSIRLLKESIESSHRMKHGTRINHLHADLKDIRKLMLQ